MHPKKNKFISGGADRILRIWDYRSKSICYYMSFDYSITAIDWSEDEKLIIVGDGRGYIHLYEYEE